MEYPPLADRIVEQIRNGRTKKRDIARVLVRKRTSYKDSLLVINRLIKRGVLASEKVPGGWQLALNGGPHGAN